MSFLEKNRNEIKKLLSSLLEENGSPTSLELGVVHFTPACEVIAVHLRTKRGDVNRVLYRGIVEKALGDDVHAMRQINRILSEAVSLVQKRSL